MQVKFTKMQIGCNWDANLMALDATKKRIRCKLYATLRCNLNELRCNLNELRCNLNELRCNLDES